MGCLEPPSLKIANLGPVSIYGEVSAITNYYQFPSLPVSPINLFASVPPTCLFLGARMILFPRTSRCVRLNRDSVAASCSTKKSRFAVRFGAKAPPRRPNVKCRVEDCAKAPSCKVRRADAAKASNDRIAIDRIVFLCFKEYGTHECNY